MTFDAGRRRRYLFCCTLIPSLLFLASGARVTLKTIFQASLEATKSEDVQKHMDVVAKYYFTHDKENSVWYAAQEEAQAMYNMPLSKENMQFIEKLIFAAANHYDECVNMKAKTRKRAQCFYHLASPLRDLERGSRWIAAPEISFMNKAKFGTIYNSAATLTSHLAVIAKESFKVFKDHKLSKDKLHDYIKTLETAQRMLFDYDISVINWRVDGISPPVVCEVNERLWKEFEGICETRWRRSVEADDVPSALPLNAVGSGKEKNDDSEEFDVISLEDQYETREQDSILDIADRIGHSWSTTYKKFRVQILDNVNGKVLFEQEKIGDYSSRGETMDELAVKARESRGKFVKEIKDKVTEFANETYKVNEFIMKRILVLVNPAIKTIFR